MNFLEAVNSGKQFTRQSSLDAGEMDYYTSEQFINVLSVEDVNATDYVLLPDVLTEEVLASVWNRNKADTTKSASESKFFKKIVTEMVSKGFVKVG